MAHPSDEHRTTGVTVKPLADDELGGISGGESVSRIPMRDEQASDKYKEAENNAIHPWGV
jgi:hypothetical protein